MQSRKHIRLVEFDYSSANSYFITICTKFFECHFVHIERGVMCLNEIGSIAHQKLVSIGDTRSHVEMDELIVMPNHIHCIIEILERKSPDYQKNHFAKPVANSVSIIVNQFKGAMKKWCNTNGCDSFEWHGRFYDHVIRDNREYWAIKNYIMNYTVNWSRDRFYG